MSACPAAHAQLSAPLKQLTWAICTTLSMQTSALSAVLAQLSAPLMQLFRSNQHPIIKGTMQIVPLIMPSKAGLRQTENMKKPPFTGGVYGNVLWQNL